jgi:hypothetical protein
VYMHPSPGSLPRFAASLPSAIKIQSAAIARPGNDDGMKKHNACAATFE